ncbi:hypothetical protein EDB86DRAFT_2839272 [Lactarius hatsudake]|nr:hypothetical protein EDB86DRAFT_2841102 [Lactarius hatsudake]KAH8976765.1 hypothetical protein EDB86DRAFT_2839272 [Lactarius hatsudake]
MTQDMTPTIFLEPRLDSCYSRVQASRTPPQLHRNCTARHASRPTGSGTNESDKYRGPNIFLGPSLDSSRIPGRHRSQHQVSVQRQFVTPSTKLSGLQDVMHIGTAGIVTSNHRLPSRYTRRKSDHKANILSLVADIALARVARFLLANLSGEQPGATNFSLALDVDVGRVELESTHHRPLLFGRQERTPWQPLFLASVDDVETFE